MAGRSVRVRLTAVIDDYRKAMGEAAKATGQVGEAASDAEKKSSRIGDAARTAGRVAVTGLGIAATATAALGTAALTTGLAYNSLEQTSRAALTTLLGSAQAATAQMGELREFVRTSPFPREVFIQAQQQMIAFGFAAEDVIPTLAAVQDAVAAAGGSATDIQEVVRVLSQVQSTGRVTAQELRQLGLRGIDAAQLIGDAMGKSAAQIRDDITSGALDAGTFLTTLTEQMEVRFGGAAENVRQTWVGAVDSLRGAFRDVGSVIAAPFVDPMGGGAAVDWARGLADALRSLEDVLGPVVDDLALKATPAFDAITDALSRARDALGDLDIRQVTEQLERFAPAIAGLGAAGLTAGAGMIPFLSRFVPILAPGGPLGAGIAAFLLTVPEFRDLLGSLFGAVTPLLPPLMDLAGLLTGTLHEGISVVATAVEPLVEVLGAILGVFSLLPEPVQASAVAVSAFALALRFAGPVGIAITGLATLATMAKDLESGLDQLTGQTRYTREGLEHLGRDLSIFAETGRTSGQVVELFGQDLSDVGDIVRDARGIFDAALVDPMRRLDPAVRDARDRLSDADQALADLVAADKLGTASRGFQQLADAAQAQGIELSEVERQFPLYFAAVQRAAEESFAAGDAAFFMEDGLEATRSASGGAITSISDFGDTTEEAKTEMELAAEAADELSSSLQVLFDQVWGVERAEDARNTTLNKLREDIERAIEAEDDYSLSLEGNSQEAIDNRETLRRLVEQTADMIVEDVKAGDTKDDVKRKTEQYKKELEKELEQLGFNRDEIREYTGQLDDVPDEVETAFTTTGIEVTMKKLEELGAIIDGLPSRKDVTIAALTGTSRTTFGHDPFGGFASGGPVNGAGSPTSDSIPAWLSDGEFVMKAAARAKYGDAMMAAINAGIADVSLPGFGGPRSRVHVKAEPDLDATDFINAAGRVAASLGVAAGLSSGRVLPRGSYRIGRGSAAHGYGALDLPAPIGTPVYSVAPGVVSRAMRLATSYGIHAFVNHPGNRQSRYAHLSSLAVRAGQTVTGGQLLGRVGSTGNSTGPHLHYEDLKNGVRRAPERLGIFDQGGLVKPGFGGFNLTTKPEAFLSPRQTEVIDRLAGAVERVASGGGSAAPPEVRVFIGDRELTDMVRVEISDHDRTLRRRVSAGTGRAR